MKKHGPSPKVKDDFIATARRAFRRVAKKLRVENARLGIALVVGKNGRVALVPAN